MISQSFLKNNYNQLNETELWEIITKNIEESQSHLTSSFHLLSTAAAVMATILVGLLAIGGFVYSLFQQNFWLGVPLAAVFIFTIFHVHRTWKETEKLVRELKIQHYEFSENQLTLFFELKEKLENKKKAE